MKGFLKDVPDLDFLPKGIYEGVEVGILSIRVDADALLIHDYRKNPPQFWVHKSGVKPIPELTHWEASDFHKWFAENGMKGTWVKFGKHFFQKVISIENNHIQVLDEWNLHYYKVPFSDVTSIKSDIELVKCTKPIK